MRNDRAERAAGPVSRIGPAPLGGGALAHDELAPFQVVGDLALAVGQGVDRHLRDALVVERLRGRAGPRRSGRGRRRTCPCGAGARRARRCRRGGPRGARRRRRRPAPPWRRSRRPGRPSGSRRCRPRRRRSRRRRASPAGPARIRWIGPSVLTAKSCSTTSGSEETAGPKAGTPIEITSVSRPPSSSSAAATSSSQLCGSRASNVRGMPPPSSPATAFRASSSRPPSASLAPRSWATRAIAPPSAPEAPATSTRDSFQSMPRIRRPGRGGSGEQAQRLVLLLGVGLEEMGTVVVGIGLVDLAADGRRGHPVGVERDAELERLLGALAAGIEPGGSACPGRRGSPACGCAGGRRAGWARR